MIKKPEPDRYGRFKYTVIGYEGYWQDLEIMITPRAATITAKTMEEAIEKAQRDPHLFKRVLAIIEGEVHWGLLTPDGKIVERMR